MNTINLNEKNDHYEIEFVAQKKIFAKIYTITGAKFNEVAKRWIIPKNCKEEFINKVKDFASVEVIQNSSSDIINLVLESDCKNDKFYITISNYLSVYKFIEPLMQVIKKLPKKNYDSEKKRWVVDLKYQQLFEDEINQLKISKKVKISCEYLV